VKVASLGAPVPEYVEVDSAGAVINRPQAGRINLGAGGKGKLPMSRNNARLAGMRLESRVAKAKAALDYSEIRSSMTPAEPWSLRT
jgi:hypothetical protein